VADGCEQERGTAAVETESRSAREAAEGRVMQLVPEWEHLRPSLVRWAWRGALCALPSFFWASLVAIRMPAQVLAMLLGVASYVVAYAWLTAQPAYREGVEPGDFGWALRVAANTRAALAPVMVFGPDMWLGMISTHVVQWSVAKSDAPAWAMRSLFAGTYVTTLVQGALVSATMLLLALLLWPARRASRTRRTRAT
jgi:hypothetical protein